MREEERSQSESIDIPVRPTANGVNGKTNGANGFANGVDGAAGDVIDISGISDSSAPAAPPAAAGGRGWIPSATLLEAAHPSGYTWRETEQEIEVRVPLSANASSKSAIQVELLATSIRVVILGEPLIAGELCGRLSTEESAWSLVPAEDAGEAEGGAVLLLDLMKKRATSAEEPLWGYILRAEREAATGHVGD